VWTRNFILLIFQSEILRKLGLTTVPNVTVNSLPNNHLVKNLIQKATTEPFPLKPTNNCLSICSHNLLICCCTSLTSSNIYFNFWTLHVFSLSLSNDLSSSYVHTMTRSHMLLLAPATSHLFHFTSTVLYQFTSSCSHKIPAIPAYSPIWFRPLFQ
jgi:hypothetical protein